MADFENNNSSKNINTNDVLTELEALSKKYGLDFDASKFRTSSVDTYNYSPGSNPAKITHTPKNNRPARTTSRIVFDETKSSGVKVVYDDYTSAPVGPQGKRVVYQEQEHESIAEKRRKNAALQAARISMQQQNTVQPPVTQEKSVTAVEQHPVAEPEKIVQELIEPATVCEKNQDELDILISDDSFFQLYSEAKSENKDTVNTQSASEEESVSVTKRPHQHYETSGKEKIAKFFRSFIPWRGDKPTDIFRKIVMDISVVVIIFCLGIFANYFIEHRDELKNQQEIELLKEAETTADDNLEQQWEAIREKYPDVEFPEGINIKYADLYAKNQDFVGWLHIDNTNIDTAIVHRPSDRDSSAEDYYVRRNFFGSSDKYGNPFLDKYNTGSELDKNNIIHGHNMTDGLSFAQLEKYYTIDGFKESPIIEYSTLYGDYKFKVYAAIITNGSSSGDNGYLFSFITAHFPTDENFESFIQAIDERKLYDTGVDINKDDILITLSTCSYEIKQTGMGRLAVIGRLVREGESESVDTSLAVENENVRYPQIWYDEHNIKNPYKDAYRWKPE